MSQPIYPLLAFYGDDFTGSTDALEVLASHRLETLLFLRQPNEAEIALARSRYAAVGIAGISRARNPEWMDHHLPPVYGALKQLRAAVCHYKVCSTFDSSPAIGNIAHALLLGRTAFDMRIGVPIVVGVPQMRRYTFFGHLFAGAGSDVVRIDRHPTMSVHPVTPMNESDLRIHLARQAALRIGLMDPVAQQDRDAGPCLAQAVDSNDAVLFDVVDTLSQARVGEMLWSLAEQRRREQAGSLFCVGSSGVQYALVSHWTKLWPDHVQEQSLTAAPVERIIAVSGSCSPVTAEQIRTACSDGFADIRVNAVALIAGQTRSAELNRLKRAANEALDRVMSPLVYTACGPDDPAIACLRSFIDEQGLNQSETLDLLGLLLGEVLRELIQERAISRVVVAGGDTSGAVVQALDLSALQMQARLSPGAPLCQAYAELDAAPLVEIALKGGQMGKADYFQAARRGRP